MDAHVVYCSACDREVRVVLAAPAEGAVAGLEVNSSGVCVDYCNDACTGSLCPLFNLPPAEMLENLRRSGLVPARDPAPELDAV